MTKTSIFDIEHARVARRLADKLGGAYGNENISCELMGDNASITVYQPAYPQWVLSCHIGYASRGLEAALTRRTEEGYVEAPITKSSVAKLEAWIDQHIAEREES